MLTVAERRRLNKALREGAIANREEDRQMAEEWFELEEEAYAKLEKQRR